MPTDRPAPRSSALPPWSGLGLGDLWRWPLGSMPSPLDRAILRAAVMLARRQVLDIAGWERILPECDPFVLVANHGSRRETVYLAAALMLARGGRPVHFLADWSFRLIPGVDQLYQRSGAITVTRKDARPRILNRLKPRFTEPTSPLRQAQARLLAGGSVALFPEGTVNRNPRLLLRGRFGASRLSLETGTPVLPVGIRFIGSAQDRHAARTGRPMAIRIGAPLDPPGGSSQTPSVAEVHEWHKGLMQAIAELCGKRWSPGAPADRRTSQIVATRTAESVAHESGGLPC